MPLTSDLREARAELQKMLAEAADDKAFGMFGPALQKRITQARKDIADLTVAVGKQSDAEKRLAKEQRERASEEQRVNRLRIAGATTAFVAYRKIEGAVRSLRDAGMENTIQANREHLAYQLLGREIAGVFLPATTAATNASLAGAKALSGISESGQNVTMVLAYAVSGLAALKVAQLGAAAAGLKFSGSLAVIMRNLGTIGLAGGVIGGLGALFLSGDEGAKILESTMESLVKLANALGEALSDAFGNPGKFFDDFKIGLAAIGEKIGLAPEGRTRTEFNEAVKNAKGRGGLDARRAQQANGGRREVTPGIPNFGSVDSFERLQLAAARVATGRGVPEQQLDVAKEQLEELKKANGNRDVPARVKMMGIAF